MDGGGHDGLGVDPSTCHILLADKDLGNREDVSALLADCGYPVTHVPSGRAVIELLQREPGKYKLVLKDHDPPSVNGFRLLRKLGRDPQLSNVPVIIMSPNAERETVVESLHLGAVDYLVKPLRVNELRNLWTHVWRRMSGMVGAGSHPPRAAVKASVDHSISTDSGESEGSDDSGPERSSGQGNREDAQGDGGLELERGEQHSDDGGDKRGGHTGQTMASAFLHYGQSAGTAAAAQQYQRLQGPAGSESGNPRGDRDSPEETPIQGEGSGSAEEANTANISQQKANAESNPKPSSSKTTTTTTNNKSSSKKAGAEPQHSVDPWFSKAAATSRGTRVISPVPLPGAPPPHLLGVPGGVPLDRPLAAYSLTYPGSYPHPHPGMDGAAATAWIKGYKNYYDASGAFSSAAMAGLPPGGLYPPHLAVAAQAAHAAWAPVSAAMALGHAAPHAPHSLSGGGAARGITGHAGHAINSAPTPPPGSMSAGVSAGAADQLDRTGGSGGVDAEGAGAGQGRDAALSKYRMKRNQRCFSKKIRYASRKQLAETRPRIKGQFVSYAGDGTPEDSAMDDQLGGSLGGGAGGEGTLGPPDSRPAKAQRCKGPSPRSTGSGGSGGTGGSGSGGSNEQNARSGEGSGGNGQGSGSGNGGSGGASGSGSGDISKTANSIKLSAEGDFSRGQSADAERKLQKGQMERDLDLSRGQSADRLPHNSRVQSLERLERPAPPERGRSAERIARGKSADRLIIASPKDNARGSAGTGSGDGGSGGTHGMGSGGSNDGSRSPNEGVGSDEGTYQRGGGSSEDLTGQGSDDMEEGGGSGPASSPPGGGGSAGSGAGGDSNGDGSGTAADVGDRATTSS